MLDEEVIAGAYLPWFLEKQRQYVQVSDWQFMFLQELHVLVATNQITLAEAQLMESSFFFNGMTWVDKFEEQKSISNLYMDAMLLKRPESEG